MYEEALLITEFEYSNRAVTGSNVSRAVLKCLSVTEYEYSVLYCTVQCPIASVRKKNVVRG